MKFEWDEGKNQMNIKKHNISFEVAETVFQDMNAVYVYDELHSAVRRQIQCNWHGRQH